MPTTQREAGTIRRLVQDAIADGLGGIISDYHDQIGNPLDEARATRQASNITSDVFNELLQVAYLTDNYSVRQSLFMIKKLCDPSWEPSVEDLITLSDRYNELQPEMSRQEFLGLDDNQYKEYLDSLEE